LSLILKIEKMPEKKRGKNFSTEEIMSMLDTIEMIKAAGGNRWNQVAEEFAAISIRNKWPPRDEESIKRKFKNLKNVRKPTGDPNCPAEVKRAKRIQVELTKPKWF
jgi:hypothetical protein